MFTSLYRIVFPISLVLVLVSSAAALGEAFFETQDLAYGPNLEAGAQGVSAIVQGTWIPLVSTGIGLTWIEPMRDTKLGAPIGGNPRFIRFNASGVVSPWYSMIQAMIGFRVLPRVEIASIYQAQAYLNSNVRQALPDSTPSLRETWSEDYFFNHLYKAKSTDDLLQLYGALAGVDLSNRWFRGGFEYHFYLADVDAASPGKNLDYERMLPVDRRDFFYENLLWFKIPVSPRMDWSIDYLYEQTGLQSAAFGLYNKQSVSQMVAFTGPLLHFFENQCSLLIEGGYLVRPDEFDYGDWEQHVLLRVVWKGRWTIGQ